MQKPSPLMKTFMIIAILATAVLLHELGHFIVAKAVGATVKEFSLGIGPKLASYKGAETTLSFRMFPVAAYVRTATHKDEDRTPSDVCIEDLSSFKKAAIVLAGPSTNLGLVYVACGIILLIGYRWPAPVIKEIIHDSILYESGLREGDQISKIDGRRIHTSAEVNTSLGFGSRNHTVILSSGKELLLPDTTKYVFKEMWGADPNNIVLRKSANLREIMEYGTHHLWRLVWINWTCIRLAVASRSTTSLIGPIGQIQSMSSYFADNVYTPLMTFALVSTSLGLFNLLPLPITDGGQVVMVGIESLFGAIPETATMIWNASGFILIAVLLLWSSILDIYRLASKSLKA